jgi:tetratricopeptide (TPR) repeat protein
MNRARLLTALALCVGAVLLCGASVAACETAAIVTADAVSLLAADPSAESPMLLGEGEDAAGAIEALRPTAQTDLNAALRLAWLLHVYANDNAAAKPLFGRVVEANPANVWARFGLASIARLEGDAAAESAQMAAVIEHNPTHPLAELALHELRTLWGSVPEARTGTRARLRRFLDDPAVTNPEAIGLAFGLLWQHLEWNGLMDERDALLKTAGAVRSWRFAGPFEPLDDLMFFSPLEPDDDPVLAPSYTIEGQEQRTRRYDTRELDIEPLWVRGGVWYAETFIRPAAPGRALLRVVTNDSVRIELNGGTVYLKDTFHTFAPDTETVEITLPAGWSRLRVKYQAPDTVIVRLLDGRARPLAVEVDPSPRPVEQSPAAPGRIVPTACEAYLDQLESADPNNPLVHSLAAQLAHHRDNTEAAKIAALRSLDVCEDWAAGQLVAGSVLADDSTQPERIARSQAKAHYKRAIKLAGTCPPALYALALYEEQEQRTKEAIEKLEQCVEQAPHNVLWWRALYDIYTERKWAKERETALDAMLKLNADAPSVVRVARDYYNERNLFDRERAAALRLHKGTPGSTYLANLLERSGHLDEAIAEYERLAAARPDTSFYQRNVVRLLKTLGRFEAAARELRMLLADEPRSTDLMQELAEVELERGRLGEAIRLWRRALDEEPADLGTRKALALHGMKEEFDRYAVDIAPYLADASLREKYASYASVLIVDYAIEQIFANGSGRQLTHQLVLVNTKAGIEEWGEVQVPWGGELRELRVIKPDGTIVEPELVPGKYSISLTGLAEGDFIEIKYIDSTRASGAPSFIGPSFVFCSATEPMHMTRYLVMAPESLDLKIEQMNMDVAPTEWTGGGWRYWQWERHEVEPIRPEPNSVSADEYMPWVRVGFGQHVGAERCSYEA